MANWKDTYRPAKFFLIDARIAFLIVPTLLWMRWYTITVTIAVAVALWYCERIGMDVESALRLVRSWLSGSLRPSRVQAKIRRNVDFGRVD